MLISAQVQYVWVSAMVALVQWWRNQKLYTPSRVFKTLWLLYYTEQPFPVMSVIKTNWNASVYYQQET